jgi:hypothetical protein
MSKKVVQIIAKTGLAINNSLQNEEMQPMLTVFGYTPEKLAEGIALPDEAYRQNIEHQKEYGEQYQATEDLRVKSEEAHAPYITLVRLAGITFAKETGVRTAVGIARERKESFSGLRNQFKQFSNLQGNAGWLAKMAVYGVTAEKLTAGEALVNGVEDAYNLQKKQMGEGQEATRLRDEVVDTLQEWYSGFIAIARIALEDKPQYLEMPGIVKK